MNTPHTHVLYTHSSIICKNIYYLNCTYRTSSYYTSFKKTFYCNSVILLIIYVSIYSQ